MNGPRNCHLSQVNLTEKGKYCMISLLCGIFKKKSYKQTYYKTEIEASRFTDVKNKLMITGEGRDKLEDWD